jgi:hypothetical protein
MQNIRMLSARSNSTQPFTHGERDVTVRKTAGPLWIAQRREQTLLSVQQAAHIYL